ncbi:MULTISPECIES: MFS transporter [unclassified Streptomyces]|nr:MULTISPECIES: MFS transporter [unclassified Streptomyces]MYR29303.1 DHA2 family efflux MFS transporter permease subunit [Streptomyces sp. SID4945]SCD97950.1 drug resistance transporter, EmrB/QacA subfamily [Streptomyces sp. TverLS-915]SCF45454.1 drug resistance transporter, EmrB/QacA subfamily [Streptomyces sp. LcepLS]
MKHRSDGPADQGGGGSSGGQGGGEGRHAGRQAERQAKREVVRNRAQAHRWWVLAVIGTAQLMVVLDATIVNIALPSAQKALGFSNGNRQWVITAYALAFGSLLLLGGRVADMVGRKIVFLTGLVGFAAASAVGGAAQSFEMLVVARAAQGVFGAMLAPAALSLLTTTFTDAKERAKAFGIYGAVAGAGGAVGLLLGGVLTEYLDWRWCLYVNLIFAVLAIVGGARLLEGGRPAERPGLDLPGAFLATAGLFCIVYGFSNAERHHWGSAQTWGFLVGGVVLLVLFVVRERVAAHPLLPLRVVLNRQRGASYLAIFLAGAGLFGVFLFLTYYLQQIQGYSPIKTGLAFLPMVGVMIVMSVVVTNAVLPRTGPKPLVPPGMLFAAGGMAWLTGLDLHSTYAAHILAPLLLTGFGVGLIFAPAFNMATAGVRPRDAGVASAMVNTCQQVGGSVGTSLLNTLATTAATNYVVGKRPTKLVLAQAQMHSFTVAFWWSAAIFGLGVVLTGLIYRWGRPATGDQTIAT